MSERRSKAGGSLFHQDFEFERKNLLRNKLGYISFGLNFSCLKFN